MVFNTKIGRQWIKRHGKDATLTTFSKTGIDEQGDDVFDETDTSVKVVLGFGTNTRVPERLDTAMGEARPMDFEFIMLDEDAPSEPETTGRTPEITVGNKVYRVLDVEDMRVGFKRVIAESKR